ncbi:MAG: hypothetical protein KDD41_03730 [Flavobacteriales bacterium]|nr:hypothetical protein [Flavobacteriales bacterium]
MAEEQSLGYIQKKTKGSGEYEDLHREGIEMLQTLSGARWTDFNEHDPGVTILENLAYTLTDLSYKTSRPIADILVESKGDKLVSGDNGFFIPSEILTTNPITMNDFRKVLIDGITNVKNVWIGSQDGIFVDSDEGNPQRNIKGLYHIFVEMYEYASDPTALQDEENRIKKAVRKLFHAHRNLCEDLYDVTIYKPFPLQLVLKLTLSEMVNGEEIFANIFYKMSDYLTHEVRFYSLWELQRDQENVNTIFNGPALQNGFINDAELKEKLLKIVPSDIVKIIAKQAGVTSVDFFELIYTDADNKPTPVPEEGLVIPSDCSPLLIFPENSNSLMLQHDGVKFSLDLSEVKKQLAYVQAMNYGSFKSISQSFNTIHIPEGQPLDLSAYYSIRQQFPAHYGIGEYGLPTGLPAKRYAQANQLKAYLLPFDQLMTNFLAQLTNLYQIFNTQDAGLNSYFYQELSDMPELVNLIKTNEYEHPEDSLETWSQTLQTLNARYDGQALQRLNQVADHLLSRFGEQFPTYSLRKIHINCYGKKLTTEKFEDELLHGKRTLISNYAQLSYNRAKAYDYTQGLSIATKEELEKSRDIITPGIVQKMAILMGIKNYKTRFLSKVIADSGIKIYQKKEGMEIISEKLEIVYSKTDMEVVTVDDIVIIDENVENLRDSFYYIGQSGSILKDVLSNGVKAEHYQIRPTDSDKKKAYYVLYTGGKQPSVVHVTDTEDEAMQSINYCIEFLLALNQKSEGLYMIEHLLLAPPYHGNYFGFSVSLPLQGGKPVEFVQAKLQSNNDRNTSINTLSKQLTAGGSLQLKVLEVEDRYVVAIFTRQGEQLAVSSESYAEKHTAMEKKERLKHQIGLYSPGQFNGQFCCYAHYGENKVDETFFSFRMSFVLPSWPVRFQDPNFRTKLDNIIYQQAPIHLAFTTYWLELMDMIEFETAFYKWIALVANNIHAEQQMNAAYDLITKIQQYDQQHVGS